jgi:hypothetical protein
MVSVAAISGFSSSVSVSVTGLPAGVTAAPATFSLMPGSQQTVTLTASATVASGSASITISGVSGGLSHSTQVFLGVTVEGTSEHAPIRTRYLRTNGFYDGPDLQFAPPHFTVFDAAHNQFLISNPSMNEIDVFNAATETETAEIPVPMAWGLDISPLTGNLYAGTLLGDIYEINTGNYSIITRYLSSSIGPSGFSANAAFVLSDGRLALQGDLNGILGIDGFGYIVVWNPATKAFDSGTMGGGVCPYGEEGAFALSGDRTRILSASLQSSPAGYSICSYDPVAQVATYASYISGGEYHQIIPTPDGARFFLTTNEVGVLVFDAKTVQLLGQIPGTIDYATLPSGSFSAVMSLDGTTLYLINATTGLIGAYNTTTLKQTGWVPSFSVFDDGQTVPVISAMDATGLIAGPIGHGVSFVDASNLRAGTPTIISTDLDPTTDMTSYAIPTSGPESGGTVVDHFANATVTDAATLSEIYVGNTPGTAASFAMNSYLENSAQVTAPSSALPGAVDLTTVLSDGGVGIAPEGFSYGPDIVELAPNGATADGGQTGTIIGYGFGNSASQIQVTVGGQNAPVTALFNQPWIEPYPFPVEMVQFTVPPGTAGTAVDVTVTSPSGSATAKAGFHYTAAVQSYPVAGNLQAGIYDSKRGLYYFADGAQVQVLSPSAGRWLTPISLPGTSSSSELMALSESPDKSKLAVSDFFGGAIYVFDPDSPAGAQRFPVAAGESPSGLAITNAGIVYYVTPFCGYIPESEFHQLNTSTGAITDLGSAECVAMEPATPPASFYAPVLLNPDGSYVYSSFFSSFGGYSLLLDTSNNQIQQSAVNDLLIDLSVSGDGSTVASNGYLTDALLNPETAPAYIDWETWIPTQVTGQVLNQDGSILFQPLTGGIDMIARDTGRLLYRIQIPATPAGISDPLTVGGGTNTLAVITSTGVSIVDLSSLPISPADTQPFPAVHSGVAIGAATRSHRPSPGDLSNRFGNLSGRYRRRQNWRANQPNAPHW